MFNFSIRVWLISSESWSSWSYLDLLKIVDHLELPRSELLNQKRTTSADQFADQKFWFKTYSNRIVI